MNADFAKCVALVACVAVALIALIVVGGLVFPPDKADMSWDIPTLPEQLEERERVKERYKEDFYEPVTTIR